MERYVLIMGYKLGEKGITTRYVKTDGTYTNIPGFNIVAEEAYYTDDKATKEEEDINARAIYKFTTPGVPLPVYAPLLSKKVKIEGTVKILLWDTKCEYMELKQSYVAYQDDIKIGR